MSDVRCPMTDDLVIVLSKQEFIKNNRLTAVIFFDLSVLKAIVMRIGFHRNLV